MKSLSFCLSRNDVTLLSCLEASFAVYRIVAWYDLDFFLLGGFFFSFIFISWRLITLQYCSGFCHTLI